MAKAGALAFSFPLGRNGHYKPLTISAPSSATTFKAEYTNNNPAVVHSFSSKDTSLNRISTNEYWMLERTSGTANVPVTFTIDNMGFQFDSLSHLKFAAWSGSQWKDKCNGGTSGNTNEGTISTSGSSSTYGMFNLGTSDTLRCVPCRADAGEDKYLDGIPGVIIGVENNQSDLNFIWYPEEHISSNGYPRTFVGPSQSTLFIISVINSKGCIAKDNVNLIRKYRPTPVLSHPCILPNSN